MPVETTSDYIRIRVRNLGDFDEKSFRTIDINKSEGIKSVVGKLKSGDGGMVNQNFMFDNEKWTVAEAKKWVKDHGHKIVDQIDLVDLVDSTDSPGDVYSSNFIKRQIFVFSCISQWSTEYIIRQLLAMDRESNNEITMFINSPGGEVYQALAIIDTMKIIKSPVRTVTMGIAASAAACLASAGKTRLITPTAQIMIHEASAGVSGAVSTMQETVEQFAKLNEVLVKILAENCNQTVDKIKEAMNKTDKYFTAQEAVSFGLVDRIINDQEAQSLKLSEGISVEGYEFHGKEVQLLREGRYDHPRYGRIVITKENLESLKKNFDANVRGQEVSIDYTHDNENGESPAAFWIKSLEVRKNNDGNGHGLFAKGEFTPKGEKKIAEKEYKYSSADFVIDYVGQDGKHYPYVLRGGTLTNRPFIKNMNPIKLSEEFNPFNKEPGQMNKEELIAALKGMGIDVSALQTAGDSLTAQVKALEAKIQELSALPAQKETEIKALKDALADANNKIIDAEKTRVFNGLVAEGKCVPAQKDKIMAAFKDGASIAEVYKDAPVVVATKPKGNGEEGTDEELTAEEKLLVEQGQFTKQQILAGRSPQKKEPTAQK